MMNWRNVFQERVVHVRFEGTSRDIAFGVLDVGDLSSDEDGNMTVRPKAVFG